MKDKKRLLFVTQDIELTKVVRQAFSKDDVEIIVANNHLQGIGILDKTQAQVALVPAGETNINGVDFAKLIREREKKCKCQENYIILYGSEGQQNEIIDIFSSAIDDFITYPFFEPELRWRVLKGFNFLDKFKKLRDKVYGIGDNFILSPEGFFLVLESEINRIIRHNSNFSILIVYLKHLEEIVVNFGSDWKRWIEDNFLNYIKNKLRGYDKISKLKNNIYVILSPDTDIKGLKGLDKRIRSEYIHFFQKLQDLGIPDRPQIVHCGAGVCIKDKHIKIKDVVNWIKKWTFEMVETGCNEDCFLEYEYFEEGPELVA